MNEALEDIKEEEHDKRENQEPQPRAGQENKKSRNSSRPWDRNLEQLVISSSPGASHMHSVCYSSGVWDWLWSSAENSDGLKYMWSHLAHCAPLFLRPPGSAQWQGLWTVVWGEVRDTLSERHFLSSVRASSSHRGAWKSKPRRTVHLTWLQLVQTCTHTQTHTHTQLHIYALTHVHIHIFTHRHTQIHIHTLMHIPFTYTQTHTFAHKLTHLDGLRFTHTYTDTYSHKHTFTQTHAQTL